MMAPDVRSATTLRLLTCVLLASSTVSAAALRQRQHKPNTARAAIDITSSVDEIDTVLVSKPSPKNFFKDLGAFLSDYDAEDILRYLFGTLVPGPRDDAVSSSGTSAAASTGVVSVTSIETQTQTIIVTPTPVEPAISSTLTVLESSSIETGFSSLDAVGSTSTLDSSTPGPIIALFTSLVTPVSSDSGIEIAAPESTSEADFHILPWPFPIATTAVEIPSNITSVTSVLATVLPRPTFLAIPDEVVSSSAENTLETGPAILPFIPTVESATAVTEIDVANITSVLPTPTVPSIEDVITPAPVEATPLSIPVFNASSIRIFPYPLLDPDATTEPATPTPTFVFNARPVSDTDIEQRPTPRPTFIFPPRPLNRTRIGIPTLKALTVDSTPAVLTPESATPTSVTSISLEPITIPLILPFLNETEIIEATPVTPVSATPLPIFNVTVVIEPTIETPISAPPVSATLALPSLNATEIIEPAIVTPVSATPVSVAFALPSLNETQTIEPTSITPISVTFAVLSLNATEVVEPVSATPVSALLPVPTLNATQFIEPSIATPVSATPVSASIVPILNVTETIEPTVIDTPTPTDVEAAEEVVTIVFTLPSPSATRVPDFKIEIVPFPVSRRIRNQTLGRPLLVTTVSEAAASTPVGIADFFDLTTSLPVLVPSGSPLGLVNSSIANVTTTVRRTSTMFVTRTVQPILATALGTGASNTPLAITDTPRWSNSSVVLASALGTAVGTISPEPAILATGTAPLISLPVISAPAIANSSFTFVAGSRRSLLEICQTAEIRTLTIPLLTTFYGPNAYPALNPFPGCVPAVYNSSQAIRAPGLLNCTELGDEVKACQKLGKKVLLSVKGAPLGAVGGNVDYGKPSTDPEPFGPNFGSIGPGGLNTSVITNRTPNLFDEHHPPSAFALTIFSLFGEGHTERADIRPLGPDTPSSVSLDGKRWWTRPLGEEVVVDGFDVRVPREWKGTYQAGQFQALVRRLRELNDEAWEEAGGEVGATADLGSDGKGMVVLGWS